MDVLGPRLCPILAWTDPVYEIIHAVIDSLKEREALVIRLYYGLGGEDHPRYDLKFVGQELSLDRDLIRTTYWRAMRKLKHESRANSLRVCMPDQAWFNERWKTLAMSLKFKNFVASMDPTKVDELFLSKLDKLATPTMELEISIRTLNSLINSDVRFLGQLVIKSENDLLRTKNFGRRSLNEIKAILESMDLRLGMQVSPELLQKLQGL